ncbi:hypothetical protein STEG23_020872, partial [Scotinomys teguina]
MELWSSGRAASSPKGSEHERHSSSCPSVKGKHTQNVPLSVTLATSPAQLPSADGADRISCFGSGSCPQFVAAATKRGKKICVWDISKLTKVHLKFEINAYDPAIVQQLILSGDPSSGVDSRRPTLAWLEDSSSCSDIPKLEGDRVVDILFPNPEPLKCDLTLKLVPT